MAKKPKPIVECSRAKVKLYKGLKEPKCNAGRGCVPCWEKYGLVQRKRFAPRKFIAHALPAAS